MKSVFKGKSELKNDRSNCFINKKNQNFRSRTIIIVRQLFNRHRDGE